MRKFVDLLTNRWALGFVGILALSALIWFGADYIKFGDDNKSLSENARLFIIFTLFFVWLIWSLIRWGFEQRQNSQMMQELEADDKITVDPDQERSAEEIKLINDRFKEALTVLKKSRFNSGSGSKTLYQLPWYMIIGPPGAGKTTALVNSGLNFPLASSHGTGALGGIGGTRHCDWWFTNDAVLIDTAGRYTTQDSHRVVDNNAWAGFLKLLLKYRPRRPLNGVIVAISLQELMTQTSEQRKLHAVTIRSRIDELQQQLGINLPVYLMFTKGDLVAGFSEFFANLSQAERQQVWGITYAMDEGQTNAAARFSQEYRRLIKRLNQRLLWRIEHERNVDAKAKIQSFPNSMDALHNNLHEFITTTFALNKYNDSPLLRGVYFSSATQEGSPIDRMMAAVSANFGLPRSVAASQSGTGKSFFLNRLMNDVIFAESELVGTNRKIEMLLLWARRVSFAALALGSVAMIIAWAGTVTQNRIFMNQVTLATDSYQVATKTLRPNSKNIVPILDALNPLREASKVYEQDQHPWLTSIGLYDNRVDTAVKALYQNNLHRYFLPSLRSTLERQLAKLNAADAELPETLGVYLMLSDKTRQNNHKLLQWANSYWQKQYLNKADVQQQLLSHLETLLSTPLPASAANDKVVSRAQQKLSGIPMSKRLYKQLYQANKTQVDLYPEIGGDSNKIFGISPNNKLFSMPLLYTKKGFDQIDYSADSNLLNQLEEDRWIYGDFDNAQYGEAERKELSSQVERTYLTDYARNWEKFLGKLNIAPFSSLDSAVDTLELLSDPSYSPLLTTLELVTENTQLKPTLISDTGKTAALASVIPPSMQPTTVDKQFKEVHRLTQAIKNQPTPIALALESVTELKEFMDEINTDRNPGEASFKVAKARFVGTGNNPIRKLAKLASRSPEPLRQWLEQIADHSWAILLDETSQYISNEWNQQIYQVFDDSLVNRYPLYHNATYEAALVDFNAFLGPKGIENNFVNTYLLAFIDTRKWELITIDNRSIKISSHAMKQLLRARQIRKTYYAESGASMVFKFRIRPSKLDPGIKRFSIEFAKTRISYSHGPQISNDVIWKGGEDDRIRLLFEDLNGNLHRNRFSGDWAWLRLLDASQLTAGSNSSKYNATFSIGSRKARYQLSAKTSANPFNIGLLRGYRCPPQLLQSE